MFFNVSIRDELVEMASDCPDWEELSKVVVGGDVVCDAVQHVGGVGEIVGVAPFAG